MGFGHVVMPGDLRNDLFVTIVRGTFDRGKPGTSGRNIEVNDIHLSRAINDGLLPGCDDCVGWGG